MKRLSFALLIMFFLLAITQVVLASTYDNSIPWGAKNNYTATSDGNSWSGTVTVNPFTLSANGVSVDTVTGACPTAPAIPCSPAYPNDSDAYYSGFYPNTSLTFSVKLDTSERLFDNVWFEIYKIDSCSGADLNGPVSEVTLVNCSNAASYTNQTNIVQTARQTIDIPGGESVILTYTWIPAEPGYYQFDFSSDDYGHDFPGASSFHSGFIRVIPALPSPTPSSIPSPTSSVNPSASPASTPTPAPNPPTITSLQIGNIDSHGFTSTFQGSGRQSGPEGGKGWYNPMTVRLNATSSNGIGFYAVGFYDKSLGQQNSLEAIRNVVGNDFANGFLLIYAANDCNNQLGGCYVDNTGYIFKTNSTYVYTPSGWFDISNFGSSGKLVCTNNDCSSQFNWLYRAFPVAVGKWKVAIYKDFGSKNMYTAGYVIDSVTNLSTYQSEISSQ